MTSEARVYDDLLLVVWLCELHEEDFGGEVIDIGEAEGKEGIREFVG